MWTAVPPVDGVSMAIWPVGAKFKAIRILSSTLVCDAPVSINNLAVTGAGKGSPACSRACRRGALGAMTTFRIGPDGPMPSPKWDMNDNLV